MRSDHIDKKRFWHRLLFALGFVIVTGCVAVVCMANGDGEEAKAPAKLTAKEKVKKDLSDAHAQADAALAKRVKSVRDIFNRGRQGADAFAGDAFSWSGKWILLKEKIGLGESDGHGRFLAESFAKHVVATDDLKAAIDAAIKGYMSDLDAVENTLLVRLRADLSDSELGRSGKLPSLKSDDAFREEYRHLADETAKLLKQDLNVEFGRQVAGLVVMDVATPVVIRIAEFVAAELGVEAGILTAGAGSGVATLGIGLVVGIVADQVIGWVLKKAGYDVEKEVAGQVRESLDRMENLIIDGTAKNGGLKRELANMAKARAKIQDAVVEKLLSEGGMP